MYQQILLIGNLGGDPEAKTTPSGVPLTTFSLAVNTYHGKDAEDDEPLWFKIQTWRKRAKAAATYLSKGKRVLVVGVVEKPFSYLSDGEPRTTMIVTAHVIKFLSGRGDVPESEMEAAMAEADMPDDD